MPKKKIFVDLDFKIEIIIKEISINLFFKCFSGLEFHWVIRFAALLFVYVEQQATV